MGKNNRSDNKGGDKKWKFVQTLVSPEVHKALTVLALDKGCTLALLLRYIIETFTEKESENGRRNRSNTEESQEAF